MMWNSIKQPFVLKLCPKNTYGRPLFTMMIYINYFLKNVLHATLLMITIATQIDERIKATKNIV